MKNLRMLSSCVLLFLLCSGCEQSIDERYAAEVVKKELAVSGDVLAHRLGGGASGDAVFLVTDDSKKYVVKCFKNKKDGELEMYNSTVASDGGYGPKVYFASPSRGVMISEYLIGRKISPKDLQTNQLYIELGCLLQKIHWGKEFKSKRSRFDVFRRIDRDLRVNQNKCGPSVPLREVADVVATIRKALLPYQETAPCHNDFQTGNLVFFGNEFKAIDYGCAGPGEPYFDVATAVAGLLSNPDHDRVLLTAYLGREPSAVEKAKLCLLKEVAFAKWACDRLNTLSAEDLRHYDSVETSSSSDEFLTEFREGKIDLSRTEDRLRHFKVNLKEFFKRAQSQECRDALDFMNNGKRQ